MMLQRNLLYTAITRAKKVAILVGNRKALAIAVSNNKVALRYSGLLARLQAPPTIHDDPVRDSFWDDVDEGFF